MISHALFGAFISWPAPGCEISCWGEECLCIIVGTNIIRWVSSSASYRHPLGSGMIDIFLRMLVLHITLYSISQPYLCVWQRSARCDIYHLHHLFCLHAVLYNTISLFHHNIVNLPAPHRQSIGYLVKYAFCSSSKFCMHESWMNSWQFKKKKFQVKRAYHWILLYVVYEKR